MVLCQYNFFKRNIQPLYIRRSLHPALNDRKIDKILHREKYIYPFLKWNGKLFTTIKVRWR